MKTILQQNARTSTLACIMALACLAFTSAAGAATTSRLPVADDGARQTSRGGAAPRAVLLAQSDAEQKMIDDCRKNFGTDCAHKAREAMMLPDQRRQVMIERYRNNFGTACEKSVDTELAAEQNQQRFIQPKPAQ